MTIAETTSLILTLLANDDAQTARELAAELGTTSAKLRPALRQLVESEVVVTSGRAGGTRYMLAAESIEQPAVPQSARKPRAARPVIPATVDLESALQATAQRLESGATLAELSARPAPTRIVIADIAAEIGTLPPAPIAHRDTKPENVLRRECSTPDEDVAARKLALQQQEAAGEAHDRATERRERRAHAVMALVSTLMVLAPVAWVVAHFVR